MPTVYGIDNFNHGDFTVPGGADYVEVQGTPVLETTIVPPGWPASVKMESFGSNTEYLGRQDWSGSQPGLGWHGFYHRMSSAYAPANMIVSQFWSSGYVDAAKLLWAWDGASGMTYHVVTSDQGEQLASPGMAPDIWRWIEIIFKCDDTSHTCAWAVDGDIQTSSVKTGLSVSTAGYPQVGFAGAGDAIQYFAHWMWGSASSLTDFLGEPVSGQVVLPDADVATTGWSTSPLYSKLNDSSDSTYISGTAS